jgi:hypothetical protein
MNLPIHLARGLCRQWDQGEDNQKCKPKANTSNPSQNTNVNKAYENKKKTTAI